MHWRYGAAVVDETLEPARNADLRRLALMEYGPTTGSAFLLVSATSSGGDAGRQGFRNGRAFFARAFGLGTKLAPPRAPSAGESAAPLRGE